MLAAALLAVCLAAEPGAGEDGQLLRDERTGVQVWWKAAGPKGAPVVLYLHGGPGYNAFSFEAAVGRRLEKRFRMVYLDQRGGGRSPPVDDLAKMGMDALVDDVERIRVALGVNRIGLIAHAFGAVIAVSYLHRYPDRVRGLVLVDATVDVRAALEEQLAHLASIAPAELPDQAAELQQLTHGDEPPSRRILRAYRLLGRRSIQQRLLFGSPEALERADDLDEGSGLRGKGNAKLYTRMQQDGYLDRTPEELLTPISVPAALFAGRQSHAVGERNLQRAARDWRISLVWFEQSGHFPFLDEPELFASRAIASLAR